jgi:hypothetical protein
MSVGYGAFECVDLRQSRPRRICIFLANGVYFTNPVTKYAILDATFDDFLESKRS